MSRVIVVGAGRVGRDLADRLDNATLVEADPAKFTILQRENPGLQVVGGDARQPEILSRAGAADATALVLVTNKDYVNWKIALAAAEFGVPKIVARLRDESYRQKLREAGVTHIISPVAETIEAILAEVFPTMETVTDIAITCDSPLLGKRIGDIQLPPNSLVAAVRKGDRLLRASADTVLKEGDIISLVSIGELEVEIYEAMAGQSSAYIPRSKVVFLLCSEDDLKAMKEVAFLCSRFKVGCEIVVSRSESRLVHEASVRMQSYGVELSFKAVDGELLPGFLDHVSSFDRDCGALIAVHQVRKGPFGHLLPLKFIKRLLASTSASILIARGHRYERILNLVDESEDGERCTRCAVSMAMDTTSCLYTLFPFETGRSEQDIARARTKRMARIYGIEIIEDIVTGDPTLEFVQKVRGKPNQLVVVNWCSPYVRKDILSRIINDSEASVLVVGGQENL